MQTAVLTFTVSPAVAGSRLDRAVADLAAGMSRSQARRLIEAGRVTVNGIGQKASLAVRAGDEIAVTPPDTAPPAPLSAEPMPLEVVYEDAALLVVNKPAGLVVHPAPGHPSGTLVNAVLHHTAGRIAATGAPDRPGIVHRLDRYTSGLLCVAKTPQAHTALAEQFAAHTVEREYVALVWDAFTETGGTIDAPVGRSVADRKRMAVAGLQNRRALTHFTVAATFRGASELRLRLDTGRTHQVRVHCAYIGHGVIGDPTYGSKPPRRGLKWPETLWRLLGALPGQLLHATTLGLTHPVSGERRQWDIPPPAAYAEFRRALAALDSD